MHRTLLQANAQAKLDDAEFLFSNRRFSNSYYLFGYAAELAIKSCISLRFQPETIPDRKFVADIYSHDLTRLVGLAGLAADLSAERKASPMFDGFWATVSDWNESSRYDMVDVFSATAMRNAMMHPERGVFEWLRRSW